MCLEGTCRDGLHLPQGRSLETPRRECANQWAFGRGGEAGVTGACSSQDGPAGSGAL